MVPEPHTLRVITSEVVITISCTQYSLAPPSLPSPDMKNTLITARVKFSDQHGPRSKGAQAGDRLGGEQAKVRPGPLSQQHGIAAPHHDINRADALVPTEPDLVFPTITTRPLLHLLLIYEDLATTQKMQQNKNSRNRQHKRAGERDPHLPSSPTQPDLIFPTSVVLAPTPAVGGCIVTLNHFNCPQLSSLAGYLNSQAGLQQDAATKQDLERRIKAITVEINKRYSDANEITMNR